MNTTANVPSPNSRLILTGERTLPDITSENYWFTRHEIVYQFIAKKLQYKKVLDAGAGEGYGAHILASAGAEVLAVDYDAQVIAHIKTKYPQVQALQANLAEIPVKNGSFDAIVNLQVIEHLWDQAAFISHTYEILKPEGVLYISTPNRLTFSPDHAQPLNHFHTKEFSPTELYDLLRNAGYTHIKTYGIFHGDALRALDTKWNNSIIQAQIEAILSQEGIKGELLADIASLKYDDFIISSTELDASLDLFFIASKTD